MKQILLILTLLLTLPAYAISQSYEDSEQGDLQALIDIYITTDGANWHNTRDGDKPWDITASSLPGDTDWWGVTTELINGERRVVHLDLQGGTHSITSSNSIPDDYGNNLNNAELIGDEWELKQGHEFPESIGNLTRLRYLNLKHNTLRGPVPEGITNLVNAERILLAGHPREPQYGSGNVAPGNHPSSTGTASSDGISKAAQALNIWEGSLPENVGNLQRLEIFELAYTGITGPLPDQFGDLPELRMLIIHGNSLSGALPVNLGNASKLRYLFAHHNEFSGHIPPELGKLSDMRHLRLSGNNFTGIIPEELGNIHGLRFISLADNPFDPQPFPIFFLPREGHNESLNSVLWSNINLTGSLPEEYDVSHIQDGRMNAFVLSNNNLTGPIPNWITEHDFVILNLRNNEFSGDLPAGFFDNNAPLFDRLRNLYLYRNNLTGPLPSVDFGRDIRNIYLYENNFTGSIPAEWGNIVTDARNTELTIRLHNNSLSGPIPVEVADLTVNSATHNPYLDQFDISGNKFKEIEIEPFKIALLSNHPRVDFDYSNQNPDNYSDDGNDENDDASEGSEDNTDEGGNENQPSQPETPNLISPFENQEKVSLTPTFEWSVVEGADYYIIRVNSEDSSEPVILTSVYGTSFSPDEPLHASSLHDWRVRAVIGDEQGDWSSRWDYRTSSTADNDDNNDELSMKTELNQNYPNPFNPTTQIRFNVPETQHVTLKIYDLSGRLVATLVDGMMPSGNHQMTFKAEGLASGVYFYRFVTQSEVITRKMTLMK